MTVRRVSVDARLQRLEAQARSRAADRRARRRADAPVRLSPEEEEEQLRRSLEVLSILMECGALERPPDQCPRTGTGDPLCSACVRWQEFGAARSEGDAAVIADDETCALVRWLGEVLPLVNETSDSVVTPGPQHPDELD